MRHLRAIQATLAVGLALLVSGPLPQASAEASGFEVSFHPPGTVLRGEDVTLSVLADTATSGKVDPEGDLYVRGDLQTGFTRLHLSWSSNPSATRVPAGSLTGSMLESYVVVTDRVSGTSFTVPAAGPDEPFRSWILDDPPTVSLGKHRFGQIRAPDAIVVQAAVGRGAGEVGVTCPADGPCDAPQSFDVALDGTIWIADEANSRLVAWAPGEPGTPSRTIPLDVAAADVAVGPDGRIYVWGVTPGVGMRLYAFDPDGKQLWMEPTLSDIFNDHIRIGPGGVLYIRSSIWGWVPAVDGDGQPLDLSEQRRQAQRDQLVSADLRLVISSGCSLDPDCDNPFDARVGLVTASGALQQAWRITSANVLVDEPEDVTPAVVDGDPVVISAVYDFEKHLKEFEVLRLSADGGVADSFSLGRGVFNGDLAVTDVRVGPDGQVYQMQLDAADPEAGMKIARYALAAATPTPTPSATLTPTTSAPTTSVVPSQTEPPQEVTRGGWSPAAWVATSLGGLALAGGLVVAVWLRRRARPSSRHGHGGPGPDPADETGSR